MKDISKHFVLTATLFCLSLLVGINVYAADVRPCADDIAKFCKGIQPGGGGIANCLKEHETDLSPACKARAEEMMLRANEMHRACADDVDKFCKDVQPGRGDIARCLREHKSELSSQCTAELGKRRHSRE